MLKPPKQSVFVRHRALFIWAGIIVHVVLYICLAAIVAIVGISIFFKVTEEPKSCQAICHNMKPSYESWRASTHDGIICAKCHSKPGLKGFLKGSIVAAAKESYLYISGEYGKKPIVPEMYDESCLREECHENERLNEERYVFSTVLFSHRNHLSQSEGKNRNSFSPIKCVNCHFQSTEKHMEMESEVCFLCHFSTNAKIPATKECLSCHQLQLPETELVSHKEIMTELECTDCHEMPQEKAAIDKQKCIQCHQVNLDKLMKKANSSDFMHRTHISESSPGCLECHEPIEHSME